ncbi:MAG: hypothetical protein IJS59_01625 [Bacteroidaceae bacterium]|nr:hypothetical protein [Bacteroidaceae bacterium]
MKHFIYILPLCAMALTACDLNQRAQEQAQHERDSLMQVINERDTELNDIMGSINEVQEGFRLINEAEGRITVANASPEGASSREVIRENMGFIQQTMQENRNRIAQLQERLRTSNINVSKLTKTIENLKAQLEEQNVRLQELTAQLAERDIVIAAQSEQIDTLQQDVKALVEDNVSKENTIATQDRNLHKAWFVFGTKAELKEQKILEKGDVLRSKDFNRDYFTEIDIRIDKEIKLYSKNAELLTSHPDGSYQLVRDAQKQYVLHITDPQKFWSTSKYLVILVK